MDDVGETASLLQQAGLPRMPPHVLVRRWLALLAGEEPAFLDVALDAGGQMEGCRYTFLALTGTAVCYLAAEHADPMWEDRALNAGDYLPSLTPRDVTAWRRPLSHVSEIGLDEDPRRWFPTSVRHRGNPGYVLTVGGDQLRVPLRSHNRVGDEPDASPAVAVITEAWRTPRSAT